VDDTLVVGGGQGLGERSGDREEPIERQAALGDDAVERLALDELHRQEVDAVGLLDRVDGDDALVVEGGEGLRLSPEAFQPLGARGHLRRQHLERHVAAELGVGGTVHLAHSAGADRGGDAVMGEAAVDQGGGSVRWRCAARRDPT
jgi:hypothetical protein